MQFLHRLILNLEVSTRQFSEYLKSRFLYCNNRKTYKKILFFRYNQYIKKNINKNHLYHITYFLEKQFLHKVSFVQFHSLQPKRHQLIPLVTHYVVLNENLRLVDLSNNKELQFYKHKLKIIILKIYFFVAIN